MGRKYFVKKIIKSYKAIDADIYYVLFFMKINRCPHKLRYK